VATAFVLTGGATHGAVQAGMLVALLEAGWRPDIIVGSSVGAMNGAFLACDPTPEGTRHLSQLWTGLRRRDLFPVRPRVLAKGFFGRHRHLFEPSGLAALIAEQLPVEEIEATKARLVVMATDAVDASPVALTAGSIRDALLASCAIPGLLPPVTIDGRQLVDGAIGASAPIAFALAHGASKVIVLPTTVVPRRLPRTALGMAVRGVDLLVQRSNAVAHETSSDKHDVVTVPAPEVTESPYSFRHSRRLLAVGYDVAHDWLQTQPRPPR
jgi:NTE family protein